MLIPINLRCQNCHQPAYIRVHLHKPELEFQCASCGSFNLVIPSVDVTPGTLILARSVYELEVEKDYDMAIVLAATSLDCGVSCLFTKWQQLDALCKGEKFSPGDSATQLRRMRRFTDKLTGVAQTLWNEGLEGFVRASPEWCREIEKCGTLRIGHLAQDIQKELFKPRNQILHQGFSGFPGEKASNCVSIARLGLSLLRDIDQAALRVRENDGGTSA